MHEVISLVVHEIGDYIDLHICICIYCPKNDLPVVNQCVSVSMGRTQYWISYIPLLVFLRGFKE
jgi:hypothetical protein